MEQAREAETVGFHSDDGKAFPPPTMVYGGKIPATGYRFNGGLKPVTQREEDSWRLVKPSAIPRLFAELAQIVHPWTRQQPNGGGRKSIATRRQLAPTLVWIQA